MHNRGVSTTLGYVLALGITALLISGILMAGGNYVDGQRERVVRSELEVLSQRLATDIASADRLNETAEHDDAVRIETQLPRKVGGLSYEITISLKNSMADHPDLYEITLETSHPTVSYTESTTVGIHGDLETGTFAGGDLRIVYVSSETRLEVDND